MAVGDSAADDRCNPSSARFDRLTVGWSPATRADLEGRAKNGVAVVRYADCRLQVLPDCRVEGRYTYEPRTIDDAKITLGNRDRLQAVLPDVARELASELERGRGLSLLLTTVGSYLSSLPAVSPRELQGNCEGATHYVASIWAGAFELKSLDERSLTTAGVLAACAAASPTAGRPPPQCAELVKIELVTLAGPRGEGGEGGDRRGEGSAGPLGDGSIVTGTGREVYLIENGRRREIPDIQTFKALGLDPHKMVTVSDDELARIPLGEPLPRR